MGGTQQQAEWEATNKRQLWVSRGGFMEGGGVGWSGKSEVVMATTHRSPNNQMLPNVRIGLPWRHSDMQIYGTCKCIAAFNICKTAAHVVNFWFSRLLVYVPFNICKHVKISVYHIYKNALPTLYKAIISVFSWCILF